MKHRFSNGGVRIPVVVEVAAYLEFVEGEMHTQCTASAGWKSSGIVGNVNLSA